MIVKHITDVTPNTSDVKGVARYEMIRPADGAPRFALRVFVVAPGESTPAHTHWWEHEVYVLSGHGEVMGDEGTVAITPDTAVYIAPEEGHCFINTGSEPLRFVCCIPTKQ